MANSYREYLQSIRNGGYENYNATNDAAVVSSSLTKDVGLLSSCKEEEETEEEEGGEDAYVSSDLELSSEMEEEKEEEEEEEEEVQQSIMMKGKQSLPPSIMATKT